MIGRTGIQALKALLELAQEPSRWRSVTDLAAAQGLPAPYLEQLLLRLRRAGVLEARRGRQGGYRLVCSPAQLSLGQALAAVGAWPGPGGGSSQLARGAAQGGLPWPDLGPGLGPGLSPTPDVRSPRPPEEAPKPFSDAATERVAALLQRRLAQAIERELDGLTLEELLFDLRSARASLSEEGGLILG